MEEEINEKEKQVTPMVRPVFLTIICVLTFLGSGLMAISFFFTGIFHELVLKVVENPEFKMPGVELFQKTAAWAFVTASIFYTISVIGGIFMWNLKKVGFHLYTAAQIGLLFLSSYYIYPGGLPTGDLLFATTFVLLYAMHLKIMQ